MAAFFSIALLVWTAMNLYVLWGISSLPALADVPHTDLAIAGVVLWGSYIAGRILARRGSVLWAAPLEWIGAYWLGVIFLLLVMLLATDIITGFGLLVPRLGTMLRGYAVLGACLLSVIALIQGLRAPAVTSHEVRLPGLPAALDGTVVAVATDMHVGETVGANWLGKRVNQIQALQPDLIILGGDIVEGNGYGRELLEHFRHCSAPLGVFAVTGNHEFYAGVEAGVKFLESAGIQVLRDLWVQVQPGLVLAGVDDLTARRQYGEHGNFVRRALAGHPTSAATIFLSHTPWAADEARDAGAGLMLSGHTHAGQIWPFEYLVRTQFKFVSGRYDVGGLVLIVCRGTGTWGPRMRLWQRSEILRLTLRPA